MECTIGTMGPAPAAQPFLLPGAAGRAILCSSHGGEDAIERMIESTVGEPAVQRPPPLDDGEQADRDAVARALAGDRQAFGEVARRHARGLVSLCARLSGDPRVGEELAQEALARAFARLNTFRGECSFRHWLYRIAANGCRDFLKAGGRAEESAPLTGDELWARSDPERDAGTREELAALGRALSALPPTYREAFTLFHVQNLSYEEIAAITGVRVNALKVRVHRARLMLRARLAPAAG